MKIQSNVAAYMPSSITQRVNTQESFKGALASAETTQANNNASPAKRADLTNMTPM